MVETTSNIITTAGDKEDQGPAISRFRFLYNHLNIFPGTIGGAGQPTDLGYFAISMRTYGKSVSTIHVYCLPEPLKAI